MSQKELQRVAVIAECLKGTTSVRRAAVLQKNRGKGKAAARLRTGLRRVNVLTEVPQYP